MAVLLEDMMNRIDYLEKRLDAVQNGSSSLYIPPYKRTSYRELEHHIAPREANQAAPDSHDAATNEAEKSIHAKGELNPLHCKYLWLCYWLINDQTINSRWCIASFHEFIHWTFRQSKLHE